jgi:hypothetical protein
MDHARTMRDAGQRGNGPAGHEIREIRSRQRSKSDPDNACRARTARSLSGSDFPAEAGGSGAKSDPDNVLPGAKREIVVWIGF